MEDEGVISSDGFIDIRKIIIELSKDESGLIDWTKATINLASAELGRSKDIVKFISAFQVFVKDYNLKEHPLISKYVEDKGCFKNISQWGNPEII